MATVSFPSAVPRLSGHAVYLRELTEADIGPWFERATDAESADLAGDPVPGSIAEGWTWLERHRNRFRQQEAIRWAIVAAGGTESVGTVGLNITSEDRRTAKLGIVVARAQWNRGLATAALRLVKAYGFETLGLTEIQAEVLQRNPASVRLLEKLGFQWRRTISAEPQSTGATEDCVLYVVSSQTESAA